MRVPAVSVSLYFLLKQSNSVLLSMSKKLIASNLEYNTEEPANRTERKSINSFMTKLSTCSTRVIQITQHYRHFPYSVEFCCLCHLNKGVFSVTLNMSKCAGGFWWVMLRSIHPQVTVLDQNTPKNVLAIHRNCLTSPNCAWSAHSNNCLASFPAPLAL